jgi:predicted transcriptional regulator
LRRIVVEEKRAGTVTMSNKQLVLETVQGMPDEASLEEILEQLAILATIRRGEADADAGRVIPQEEVKMRISQWITK